MIEGWDYRTHTVVRKTRQEWQATIAELVKAGGRRRVEHGETFVHNPQGRIAVEIYARIPEPKPDVDDVSDLL